MAPDQEYARRFERWTAESVRTGRRFVTIGNTRLALVGVAAVLAWVAFGLHFISGWWLLVPLAGFVALVVVHERIERRRQFAERAVSYYQRGIARLEGKWAGTGNTGERFRNDDHVYAQDLDIFGRGSLFELIAAARTEAGEQALARWLLSPADRGVVLERQAAIAELRDKIELREDLALLGEDIRAAVHAEALRAWGSAAPIEVQRTLRIIALILALFEIAAFAAFMFQAVPLLPFLVVLAVNIVLIMVLHRRVSAIIEAVETPGHDLRIFSLVLERLERETFDAPLLRKLRASLDTLGRPASRQIAQLERWVAMLDSADHLFVRLIRPAVLWDEQMAMGIEAWRQRVGVTVGRWLEAVAELEALSSLASFAFERPEYVFPELLEDGEPVFEADGLQHPLIAPSLCVPNDIRLGGSTRLLIVSGSNMSGKSTLLRSVGLNTVLAWAGAPVAAQRLRLSPLQVGASIRVVDSLQDGKSRFYAEITRIRGIVDLAGPGRRLLFLLDEILSGTNSHDRRIGASAIVRGLVDRGAIGLITTHDLALAELDRDLADRAVNVHFEDHVEDGRIEFDYRLRPGVVTRSNALELMRAVGLQV